MLNLEPGVRVRLAPPGGGGYGDPRERDPARVSADVADGYVSPDAVERDYGVAAADLVLGVAPGPVPRLREALC